MKLCKDKKNDLEKEKKKLNTLIYILHNTDHLILFNRASDHKLCLITQPGLLYKMSSYSEPHFFCMPYSTNM